MVGLNRFRSIVFRGLHSPVVWVTAGAVALGGLVAGPAGAATTTPVVARAATANTNVCNIYCDGRDPAVASGDRNAATATVWSRVIELHIADGDDMAWGSIDDGSPTDEVWLDRSFDGGQTWANGSKLGDTTIPSGDTGWRTLMYNIDNPSAQGVGAVRACGKAGNRAEIACTPWSRSTVHAATPAAASVTALMQYFNPATGRWSSTLGWQDANALTTVIDYL
ncbi:MAG TPA: hypothetical protein VGI21_17700, partial [Streptosporangiaceae bacterium]